jgi:hypothetical protein
MDNIRKHFKAFQGKQIQPVFVAIAYKKKGINIVSLNTKPGIEKM